jgi:hypothetical protein
METARMVRPRPGSTRQSLRRIGLREHAGGDCQLVNADNVIPAIGMAILFLAVIVCPIVGVTLAVA